MPQSTRRKKSLSGRFRVANTRGQPKGRSYIKVGDKKFMEGDTFDVSHDVVDMDALLERGQIERDR